MSGWFTRNSLKDGDTILLVDIESGSAASALMQTNRGAARLYGELRVPTTIQDTVASHTTAHNIHKALDETLEHVGYIAASLRNNKDTVRLGIIHEVRIFLRAPWVHHSFTEKGTMRFSFEPELYKELYQRVGSVAGDARVSILPFSKAAAFATQHTARDAALVCVITGEVAELLVVEDGQVRATASIPLGTHMIYRTLASHANLSSHEARSVLYFTHHTTNPFFVYTEPLQAAATHFAEEFAAVAATLISPYAIQTLVVIAEDRVGDWFARALSGSPYTTQLFPQGSKVQMLHPKYLEHHVATLASTPDVHLMINALFVHKHRA